VRHCFSGDTETMQAYLDLDCWLGIAGPVTYPNAAKLREVVAAAPENRLVVETDCPWLPPQGHRGKRNEPALVCDIAQRVAKVRETTLQTAADMTTANARALYGLG
ncbi:MAG: TatD family hydrolase, partial [Armatimonadota bacterium]